MKRGLRGLEEQTLSIFKPVTNEEAVQRVNKILVGWGHVTGPTRRAVCGKTARTVR